MSQQIIQLILLMPLMPILCPWQGSGHQEPWFWGPKFLLHSKPLPAVSLSRCLVSLLGLPRLHEALNHILWLADHILLTMAKPTKPWQKARRTPQFVLIFGVHHSGCLPEFVELLGQLRLQLLLGPGCCFLPPSSCQAQENYSTLNYFMLNTHHISRPKVYILHLHQTFFTTLERHLLQPNFSYSALCLHFNS